jgi:glutamine amidotransferase
MGKPKVTIIDYGAGNLFSIERAIDHVNGEAVITSDQNLIAEADRLILPGVGAFGKSMEILNNTGLADRIRKFVSYERPILGICLGMQLFMEHSTEFGHNKGLGLIEGEVIHFKEPEKDVNNYKMPHMGWNKIDIMNTDERVTERSWNGTILDGVDPGSFFYFVHSYICIPTNIHEVLSETIYGRDRFCSVLFHDNIWGCQFHPEKSGIDGLHIYKNILKL